MTRAQLTALQPQEVRETAGCGSAYNKGITSKDTVMWIQLCSSSTPSLGQKDEMHKCAVQQRHAKRVSDPPITAQDQQL